VEIPANQVKYVPGAGFVPIVKEMKLPEKPLVDPVRAPKTTSKHFAPGGSPGTSASSAASSAGPIGSDVRPRAAAASFLGDSVKPTTCKVGASGDFIAVPRRVRVNDPCGKEIRIGDTVFLRHLHTKIWNLQGIEGVIESYTGPSRPPDPANATVSLRMTNSMFKDRRILNLDVFNVVVTGRPFVEQEPCGPPEVAAESPLGRPGG
jgi:hypothetical protein